MEFDVVQVLEAVGGVKLNVATATTFGLTMLVVWFMAKSAWTAGISSLSNLSKSAWAMVPTIFGNNLASTLRVTATGLAFVIGAGLVGTGVALTSESQRVNTRTDLAHQKLLDYHYTKFDDTKLDGDGHKHARAVASLDPLGLSLARSTTSAPTTDLPMPVISTSNVVGHGLLYTGVGLSVIAVIVFGISASDWGTRLLGRRHGIDDLMQDAKSIQRSTLKQSAGIGGSITLAGGTGSGGSGCLRQPDA